MENNGGDKSGMYQANDGKWYPIQGMPQGWQQGQDGKYHNPSNNNAGGAGGSYYGGGQGGYGQQPYGQQYPQQGQGYYGQQPMGHGQPVYVQARPGGGGGGAAAGIGGGLLAGLCCGCLFC